MRTRNDKLSLVVRTLERLQRVRLDQSRERLMSNVAMCFKSSLADQGNKRPREIRFLPFITKHGEAGPYSTFLLERVQRVFDRSTRTGEQ